MEYGEIQPGQSRIINLESQAKEITKEEVPKKAPTVSNEEVGHMARRSPSGTSGNMRLAQVKAILATPGDPW